jgi:hypothetical protein
MATVKRPIKKAQVGIYQPLNEKTKVKIRSEDGNYKLKLKGDKLVERRTLKGFFSGAPRAQGKMDLDADNVKLFKSLKSINNSNSSNTFTTKPNNSSSNNGKVANLYNTPTKTKEKKETDEYFNKIGGSAKAKDGKWIQKATASIKRRGTEGKCTPITKPGCTGKAKALAKTFKKIAKSNKKK